MGYQKMLQEVSPWLFNIQRVSTFSLQPAGTGVSWLFYCCCRSYESCLCRGQVMALRGEEPQEKRGEGQIWNEGSGNMGREAGERANQHWATQIQQLKKAELQRQERSVGRKRGKPLTRQHAVSDLSQSPGRVEWGREEGEESAAWLGASRAGKSPFKEGTWR